MLDTKTDLEWRAIDTAPLPPLEKDFWRARFECLICGPFGVKYGSFSYTPQGDGIWIAHGVGPSYRVRPTHWMPLPDRA